MKKRKEIMTCNVVYSGWMTKSPPEKKLTGPWKIFAAFVGGLSDKSKWKKRFFVLSKPAQSLPGIYHLNYYSDETCKRQRGSIDLEQCAEIIESLDSDQFQYLLALKTTFKAKERTYFLATETEEQMISWVRNLCSVCGMKPDDPGIAPPVPSPPVTDHPARQPTHSQVSQQPSSMGVMVKTQQPPTNNHVISPRARSPVTKSGANFHHAVDDAVSDTELRDYIPLARCISGGVKTERTFSIDSVPDEPAPPPPIQEDVFNGDDNIYKVLPIRRLDDDDLYKVPPTPTLVDNLSHDFESETYDIPPIRNSPNTTCSSSSGSQKYMDSGHLSQNMYDYPPVRNDAVFRDDCYDVLPSHDVPPSRPPKPGCLTSDMYMNLPENKTVQRKQLDINSVVITSKYMPLEGPNVDLNGLFNFPKSMAVIDLNDKLLTATPPPPIMCVPQKHEYINANEPGPINGYLTMNPFVTRDSSSTDNEVEYTDMTGKIYDSTNDSKVLYDHPPQSRPVNLPPRPTRSADKQDSCAVFSTERTRSFKKKYFGDRVQLKTPGKQILPTPSVALPQRVSQHPDYSTSEDDEEVWGTSPPAPKNKESELKYIDLDHNEATDNREPMRSPVTACPIPLTEYHDIDFKKTDALRKVKEIVSVERHKEKNSNV